MKARRSFSALTAAVVLSALVAVIATPAAVMAGGGGSIPGGNCQAPGPYFSGEYCTFFQADQGPPGISSTFWMDCPAGAKFSDFEVMIDHVEPFVYVFDFGPNPTVSVTPLGHLNYGDPGYFSPPAGTTAWYNEVIIPVLSKYPGVLNGWGYCVYDNYGVVHDAPVNHFFVTPPDQPSYKFKPKQFFSLSWGAVFGSARVLGGEAFRAPTLDLQQLVGPPETTTSTTTGKSTPSNSNSNVPPNLVPNTTPSTSPPSTARTQPSTTTSTTRGRR